VEELEYMSESEYVTLLMADPNCPRLVPLREVSVVPCIEEVESRDEEIRDGEFVYPVCSLIIRWDTCFLISFQTPGLLDEQPICHEFGVLEMVTKEEHKVHQAEVCSHWVKGVSYCKARRSKPYPPQGQMSCCGSGRRVETDKTAARKSEAIDHELRKLARRTRGGYGRYNSSRET